jgi:hypothetical protein
MDTGARSPRLRRGSGIFAGERSNLMTAVALESTCSRKDRTGRPIDFKDLLTKQGFALDKVMVLRHRPKEAALRKVLPWLAAEKPQVFNAYQREQNPDAEKALMKAEIAASFIAQDDEKALFVGLYRRKGWHPITNGQYWAIPENAAMKPFGLGGIKNHKTALWFDLEPMDIYNEWKGRLVVKWPPGRLWWRWAKTNDFPIHAIHEESQFATEMRSWEQLSLTWEDLKVLPTNLKTALSQWRGIYYIFDVKVGKGYVGSACGKQNILGRWLDYRLRAMAETKNSGGGNQATSCSRSSSGHRRT